MTPQRQPRPASSAGRWPNLFLVGAAKAGTTSLWWYLAQHPQVFMSPMKEPHFFSRIRPDPRLEMFFPHVRDEDEYVRLFSRADGCPIVGEASTSYLWEPDAAARIRDASPDARIVIMLREPVARAYSHYWNDAAEGFEERTFLEAVEAELADGSGVWGVSSVYLSAGLYADAVERYLTLFGDRVRILFFEEFVADVEAEMRGLFRFLGIDEEVAGRLELEPQNAFKRPRNALARRLLGAFDMRRRARAILPTSLHPPVRNLLVGPGEKPPMDERAAALLAEFYRADAERLSELLGRPVPWAGTG